MPRVRIQKLLAAAGFGSRRACETLIADGRVTVNGRVVRELPVLVDPAVDAVAVGGKPVRPERHVYFILNKPPGVFCTHNDPAGRKRAVDLLVGVRERVFPVGRLDSESMGLLLLTNDGELSNRLTHPRYGVPKTYRAEVDGLPGEETLKRLRAGVWLSDGRTSPAEITIVHRQRNKAILEITLREGRNREIRRMLAKFGHRVRRLVRIKMGKLSVAGLPVGAFRPLSPKEIAYLRNMAERGPAAVGADAPRGEFSSARGDTTPVRGGTARGRRSGSDARGGSSPRGPGRSRSRIRAARGPKPRDASRPASPRSPRRRGRTILLPGSVDD